MRLTHQPHFLWSTSSLSDHQPAAAMRDLQPGTHLRGQATGLDE